MLNIFNFGDGKTTGWTGAGWSPVYTLENYNT